MNAGTVILVDDEEDIRSSVQQSLELKGHDVAAFARAERALDRLSPEFPGVVVSDIRMPRMDGLQFLQATLEIDRDLPVILITGHGDVPLAVEALGMGAYDFIEKPFAAERLAQSVARAIEKRRLSLELRAWRAGPATPDPLEAVLVGRAPAMVDLRRNIRTIAGTGLDVLIVGETGTGKELVARAIHQMSERRDRPFVTINLGALPAGSIEAELFGHVPGAFPGAMRARTGRLEHGRGGTVYLDEIGSAPMELQVKLLRTLEDRAIEPLGSSERVDLDVRFVASSKAPLEPMIAAGNFRDDLLYRLNPVTLRLPPLRERSEDVPRLFQGFVAEAARRLGRDVPVVTPDRLMELATRDWPGNIRELKNAAERELLGLSADPPGGDAASGGLAEKMDRYERALLSAALAAHDGSLKATYESLGMSRKTLYEKMQKHGLRREDYGE